MNLVLFLFVTCVGVYVIFTNLGDLDSMKLGLDIIGLGILILALYLAISQIHDRLVMALGELPSPEQAQ